MFIWNRNRVTRFQFQWIGYLVFVGRVGIEKKGQQLKFPKWYRKFLPFYMLSKKSRITRFLKNSVSTKFVNESTALICLVFSPDLHTFSSLNFIQLIFICLFFVYAAETYYIHHFLHIIFWCLFCSISPIVCIFLYSELYLQLSILCFISWSWISRFLCFIIAFVSLSSSSYFFTYAAVFLFHTLL